MTELEVFAYEIQPYPLQIFKLGVIWIKLKQFLTLDIEMFAFRNAL